MRQSLLSINVLLLTLLSGPLYADSTAAYFSRQTFTPQEAKDYIRSIQDNPQAVLNTLAAVKMPSWMVADIFDMSSAQIFNYFASLPADIQKIEDTTDLLTLDFDQLPLGVYTADQLEQAINNVLPSGLLVETLNIKGVAEIVQLGDSQVLKVTHLAGQGDQQNGLQIYIKLEDHHELMFEYDLLFASAFDFNLGGKLPGLGGVPVSIPGFSSVPNPTGGRYIGPDYGFSLRSMYRGSGKAVTYMYHQNNKAYPAVISESVKQQAFYGEDFDLTYNNRTYYFPKQSVLHVEQYVRMNSPNTANGELRYRINGIQYQHLTDKIWSQSGEYGINRLYIDFFHGGSGAKWNPSQDSVLYIDNIRLRRPLRSDL